MKRIRKNYIIPIGLMALLFLSCTNVQTAQENKTFGTLKKSAVFLHCGHDQYGTFTDEEIEVIKVTNLNYSGEGSLARAIDQEGPRIVVFEVGGVIDLDGNDLQVDHPYLFIAGQTAPPPGITLIRGGLNVMAHDVMVQHITVRPGDCGLPQQSDWEVDGLSTHGAYNVVIDHCSFTWATDENLSASGPRHQGRDKTSRFITFSNCLIAECLNVSTHIKGYHSMGTLIHDYCWNIAVIGNLYAHNNQRNPMIKPNAEVLLMNNLIYNPGELAIHGTWPVTEYADCPDSLRRARVTAIGNVLIPGADTFKDMYMVTGKLLVYPMNNAIFDDVKVQNNSTFRQLLSPDTEELSAPPLLTDRYIPIPPEEVPEHVLTYAGAHPNSRDQIDQRIISEIYRGKGKVIDSQEEVEGYPDYLPTRHQLPIPDDHIEEWLEQLSGQLIYSGS